MKKRIIKKFLLLTCLSFLLGCGKKEEEAPVVYELTAYAEDQLIDGTYYVKTDSGCYPVAPGTLAIGENDTLIPTQVSNERMVWYGKDDVMIPTLYANQSLIYVTKDQIPARWVFERFEDVGYTVGLRGLTQNSGGRFETTITESTIHFDSTAVQQLNSMDFGDIVGIDQIGSTKITSDYVSRGGTITGLSQNQIYNVDVYEGSNYIKTQMAADIHAFVSYELYETAQYTYNQSTYVTIDLPDYLLSGYYYINGAGLFRYVANDSSQGISGISFNAPYYVGIDDEGNLLTKEQMENYESKTETEEKETNEGNVWRFTQSIDNTMEELSILINYSDMNVVDNTVIAAQLEQSQGSTTEEIEKEEPVPVATLLSPTGEEYPFISSDEESSALSCSVKMPISGEWIVEISGMEKKIFNIVSNINSGHSNSIVHSGNGSSEMTYYLPNALKDAQFEFTWENTDHAAVIVIEGPDGTVYNTESESSDVPCSIIESDYGKQILSLGQCIAGNYKITITGENLGRVRCTASEIIKNESNEDEDEESEDKTNSDDSDDKDSDKDKDEEEE